MRYALSAVDIALWDLLGKAQQIPLWKLLGGKRDRIALYPSLVSYDNQPDVVAHQVSQVFNLGYDAIKLHETTREAVAAAREAVGDRARIMVDVNCPWTADEAFRRHNRGGISTYTGWRSPSGRRKISPVLHGFAVPGSRFPPGKMPQAMGSSSN